MKLDELLNQNYTRRAGTSKPEIKDVYGIIYRIYCIPEDKSYIGQTFSHGYSKDSLIKKGTSTRCRRHYNDKDLESNKEKPLYLTLSKYDSDQFEIFEETRLHGKDIAKINQEEGKYIEEYNCIFPNGYNIEEIGKKYSKLLKDLSKHYSFEILKYKYEDTTRYRRKKDVCIGTYFNLEKQQLGLDKTLELLSTLDIENICLKYSNGFRIIVKVKDEKDSIRIYFTEGTREDCLEYSKKISDNIIISPSFYGEGYYKYQDKLDKVLEDKDIITIITGNEYANESRKCKTFLLMIYGTKNSRQQTLHRISFGGITQKINESYDIALEFINKLKENIGEKSSIEYKINIPK